MSSHTPEPTQPRVSLHRLREQAARGEKIAMLTCYDATFAQVLDAAAVDVLLVGDSLGNVMQGQVSTLPVTLEQMAYHTACVARTQPRAWLMTDLPYGSYEASPEQALASAVTLMRAGAQMVKLEGGGPLVDTVRFLVDRGIPVCGHLGLTPQRVHALGGFRVQGRDAKAAAHLRTDAANLAAAGAAMMVLELVPSELARDVTRDHPDLLTIGIGAGAGTAGQVLVLQDMLGLTAVAGGKRPRFVRDFTQGRDGTTLPVREAVATYVADVKAGTFPDESVHGY
ncbi:MAG: 3-methyl-2-oxobutanoate hydroxymethyltransferase [Proteobacteria bacterium]|nr:3-methyl-2-oxobutanoate hydroxymethyltransferase [Pseudomonadota bacterium]